MRFASAARASAKDQPCAVAQSHTGHLDGFGDLGRVGSERKKNSKSVEFLGVVGLDLALVTSKMIKMIKTSPG